MTQIPIDQTEAPRKRSRRRITDSTVFRKMSIKSEKEFMELMSKDDENACVRNIVKEIMRECFPRKIKVNKNFVTYVTKLLLLDPNWGIDDNFFNQRQNVQIFVKNIIEDILEMQDQPSVVTLKIQFYFACNLHNLSTVIESSRLDLKHRLARLKDDILLNHDIVDKDDMDRLYKKIVYYITLRSGLGNPTKPKVFEEALVALKSILNEEELREFAQTSRGLRHSQLEQFVKVVAGIRLFNKECDKGGEGIEDIPKLVNKAINVIKYGIQEVLLIVMDRVNSLTTIVDKVYVFKRAYKGIKVLVKLPEEWSKFATSLNMEYTKDLLIFFRQYELLVRRLLEEVDVIAKRSNKIFHKMQALLKKTHETVFMRIAIPVHIVFPLFEELADIWFQLQDQVYLLSRFSQIVSHLEGYARETNFDNYLTDTMLMATGGSQTDAQRLEKTSRLRLRSISPEVEICHLEKVKNIDDLVLEYLGFCCWKLIETQGALIPGNPAMGIVRFKGRYYVFSCEEAYEDFSANPQIHINLVLNLARRKPQLINFLQIRDELTQIYEVKKLITHESEVKFCEEQNTQTEDHLEEKRIVSKYKWNIWDYKREAVLMANLAQCATVSTQTVKQSSKNSIRTQTNDKKDIGHQTIADHSTNVPTPSNFIYGLRGRKDDQQFIIDLTRPVNE